MPPNPTTENTNSVRALATRALLQRPDKLEGTTYKIKTPHSEYAFYITINNMEKNNCRRPFEIFINSKNMENFAWIVALTRVTSAVLRREDDITFLVEELRSIFDPQGGYFKPGGKQMPSLVAEIGECLEKHMIKIGAVNNTAPPCHPEKKWKNSMNALNPNLMTTEERMDEMAQILATAIHRWIEKKKLEINAPTEKVILDKPALFRPYGSNKNTKT